MNDDSEYENAGVDNDCILSGYDLSKKAGILQLVSRLERAAGGSHIPMFPSTLQARESTVVR